LLAWYDREKRDLPWRHKPNAYRTLVSELMLQQTVVAAVLPYFERFMARFPTLQALAAAREDEVLTLWSGLGYYSRARNLHRTARLVVDELGGKLPSDEAELRQLPGVGVYSAAAVAAHRVLATHASRRRKRGSRTRAHLGERKPIDHPAARAELRARGQPLVACAAAGDFAQAMMELGALCCLPRNPRCPQCPVARFCRALATRAAGRHSGAHQAAGKAPHSTGLRRGRNAKGRLILVRRPTGTLLAGTWVLPLQKMRAGETATRAARRALVDLGLRVEGNAKLVGELRHVFTHRDATASVFRARVRGRVAVADARWVRGDELASLPLSTFARKMIDCSQADATV